MGGGGGDGGSAQLRQQEEERQARVRQAQANVNRAFEGGYRGTTPATGYDPSLAYYNALGDPWNPTPQTQVPTGFTTTGSPDPAESGGAGITQVPTGFAPSGPTPAEQANTLMQAGNLFTGRETTGGFNDAYFGNVADAYKSYYLPQLEEQMNEVKRKLPYRYASTSGSEYARGLSDLERDYQRGVTDIGSQGVQFADEQRGNIERQRGDLLSLATSGSDADLIAAQAARQAQTLSAPPQFSPIADLFARYSALAANESLGRASRSQDQQAARAERPLLFSTPRSSVRTV